MILIDNFVKQIRSIEEDQDDNNIEKEERIQKFQNEYQMKVNILIEKLGVKVYIQLVSQKISNVINL